jgi:hypothetical protein
MAPRYPTLAIVLGTLAGVAIIAGSYSFHTVGPSVLRFDGVELNMTSVNGSHSVGPTEQNACNIAGSACPAELIGGTSYNFQIFLAGNFGSSPGVWANMTVTAPFSLELNPGMEGSLPTTYSSSTGLYTGGGHFLFDRGEFGGLNLVFTVPTGFHSNTSPLWLNATLVVQTTNQTIS